MCVCVWVFCSRKINIRRKWDGEGVGWVGELDFVQILENKIKRNSKKYLFLLQRKLKDFITKNTFWFSCKVLSLSLSLSLSFIFINLYFLLFSFSYFSCCAETHLV